MAQSVFKDSVKFVIHILIIGVIVFPFHYIPSELMVVPKASLSLENTIVGEDEVKQILENFYLYTTPTAQQELEKDPLTKALVSKWKVLQFDGQVVFQKRNE